MTIIHQVPTAWKPEIVSACCDELASLFLAGCGQLTIDVSRDPDFPNVVPFRFCPFCGKPIHRLPG